MSEYDITGKSKQIEEQVRQNQERQRRAAESFAQVVHDQINQDLTAQLKNLYDNLPADYKQKVEAQEAVIKQKGEAITRQNSDQSAKIKQSVEATIKANPAY